MNCQRDNSGEMLSYINYLSWVFNLRLVCAIVFSMKQNPVSCYKTQIDYLNIIHYSTVKPVLSNHSKKTKKMASPGRVAQSVTCLATDACLTADPGVASSIPAWSHTFMEIDHEIISTVILLPSAGSFKKGFCQLQPKVCAQITG